MGTASTGGCQCVFLAIALKLVLELELQVQVELVPVACTTGVHRDRSAAACGTQAATDSGTGRLSQCQFKLPLAVAYTHRKEESK